MVTSPVSLKEIAAAAGCSPRVAAAVLNPGNSTIRVGEATQQRIIATASEMGYRANGLAQAMATGKSRVLGVAVEKGPIEHRAWMLSGAIEAAARQGYFIKVLSFNNVPTEVISHCLEWRLAGLLSLALNAEENGYLIRGAREVNLPIAILDNPPSGFDGISVSSDEMQGMRQVVQHLVELRHHDLAFLGADEESFVSMQRTRCFRAVLKEMGLTPRENWIVNSSWFELEVIDSAVNVLLQNPRPTAIICAGDPLAMRAIAGARALGLSIPREMSVTGYANFFLSDMYDPPLTTIEQSFSEMGRVGVEEMIALLEAGNAGTGPARTKIQIPTRLVVRGSTAPHP